MIAIKAYATDILFYCFHLILSVQKFELNLIQSASLVSIKMAVGVLAVTCNKSAFESVVNFILFFYYKFANANIRNRDYLLLIRTAVNIVKTSYIAF